MAAESFSTRTGAAVVIDLDRLSAAIAPVALTPQFEQWAKSPDIYTVVLQRSVATSPAGAPQLTLQQSGDLLTFIWRLDCFPKPLVSLLGAPLTPLDIGLSTLGTHRVASPDYRFAIPRPGDPTCVPAAGIASALGRLPGGLGADLALTQRAIGPAEAYAAGLVTHCIPSTEFAGIIAALADGQPVDPLLDGLHVEASSPLAPETARTPPTPNDKLSEAMLKLITQVKSLDVRESLIATYRLAAALRTTAHDVAASFDAPQSTNLDDFRLPTRAEIESGRF